MKSFITGFITIIAIAILGFFVFKSTTSFMSQMFGSPTPISSPSASVTPTPSANTKPEVENSDEIIAPTTKGGLPIPTPTPKIKGASTYKPVTKTVTTTTSHLTLTLIKSSVCPVSYITEVKDIKGPLSIKYVLKDGYSFGITAWKKDGNEIISNTVYSGNSGLVKTVDGIDYMKVRIESKSCPGNSDNWLTLTAER